MKQLYKNTALIEASRKELEKALYELYKLQNNIIEDECTRKVYSNFEKKYKQHIEYANKYIELVNANYLEEKLNK